MFAKRILKVGASQVRTALRTNATRTTIPSVRHFASVEWHHRPSGQRILSSHGIPSYAQNALPSKRVCTSVTPRNSANALRCTKNVNRSFSSTPRNSAAFTKSSERLDIGGSPLVFETGKFAISADGSAVARYGNTSVLATVVCNNIFSSDHESPFKVSFRELYGAAGQIPSTHMRTEPNSDKEQYTSKLIERCIVPMFPKGFNLQTQIVATLVSADQQNDPDVHSINAASLAMMLSDIPWNGPVGAIRIGRVKGQFVAFPTNEMIMESDINLIYAGTAEKVVMVDSSSNNISSEDLVDALKFARDQVAEIIEAQLAVVKKIGPTKRTVFKTLLPDHDLVEAVHNSLAYEKFNAAVTAPGYSNRVADALLRRVYDSIKYYLFERFTNVPHNIIIRALDMEKESVIRTNILSDSIRCDTRGLDDIRPPYYEVGVDEAPCSHGSSFVQLGSTQVFTTASLGPAEFPSTNKTLTGSIEPRNLICHNRIPPYATSDTAKYHATSRLENYHGFLLKRAILPVFPEEFSFTTRLLSEVMSADGSLCPSTISAASAALMDCGVAIRKPVSGVSVGLFTETDPDSGEILRYKFASDLIGLEEEACDMELNLAGSTNGSITLCHVDMTNLPGVPLDIVIEAINKAKVSNATALQALVTAIPQPRPETKPNAPKHRSIPIRTGSKGMIIGPGGTNIRMIEETTGCKAKVSDVDTVELFAPNAEALEQATRHVESLLEGGSAPPRRSPSPPLRDWHDFLPRNDRPDRRDFAEPREPREPREFPQTRQSQEERPTRQVNDHLRGPPRGDRDRFHDSDGPRSPAGSSRPPTRNFSSSDRASDGDNDLGEFMSILNSSLPKPRPQRPGKGGDGRPHWKQ